MHDQEHADMLAVNEPPGDVDSQPELRRHVPVIGATADRRSAIEEAAIERARARRDHDRDLEEQADRTRARRGSRHEEADDEPMPIDARLPTPIATFTF